MDCNCNHKAKHAYFFNVTEVVDGKIREVMNFNFGGHHDLAALSDCAAEHENLCPKHARQLVVGMRLLHHVLKKNADNPLYAGFLAQLNDFKQALKANAMAEK